MKKYILIPITIGLLFFFSCEKEPGQVLEAVQAPAFNALDENDFTLTDDIANDTVFVLEWSEAEYNPPSSAAYTLEADTAGGDFSEALKLTNASGTEFSLTVFALNKLMTVDMEMPVGVKSGVDFRVGASVGESEVLYSDVISVTAVTYDPPYTPETMLIMAGDEELKSLNLLNEYMDDEGWYEGYVYIDDPSAEITLQGGDEQARVFGYTGSPTLGDNDDGEQLYFYDLEQDGTAFTVDSIGYYRFRFNLFTMEASLMGTYWGVIGSAIPPYDWSVSQDMTYDPEEDIWTVEVETEDAKFKFRPNNTWNPLNYGDEEGDGVPEEYGANIAVGAGTKLITLDLSEYPYAYSVENAK